MDFRILGPLEVSDEAGLLDLPAAKHRRLLAVLLVHANQVVSTDRLIEELWAERAPRSALGTLQSYVSQLRRCLSRGSAGAGRLLTQSPGYVLRVAPGEMDAGRFESLVQQARQYLPGAPDAASTVLAEALGLWRGQALAEFSDLPFAWAERARLEEMRFAAIECRVEADLGLGRHVELVAELQALVATNPLRECLRGQLMVSLYRSGRQADALAAYQAGRRVLDEELGIEPSPDLRALEAAILRQEPRLDWHASRSAAPSLVTRPRSRLSIPWVGRTADLAVLERHQAEAAAGLGQMVLVAGEPGIGKTRLAEEFAERAADAGARVVWGSCYEGEGAPPFWPWIQVIRALLTDGDQQTLRSALGSSAGHIAHIVREVHDVVPELEPPETLSPAAARFRLYEAVTHFLLQHGLRRPLVLVVDDLHCADEPSLQLLTFLTTQLHQAPMLVLATYRDTEVGVAGPLTEALAALSRQQAVHRLALRGLDAVDVGRLIAAETGAELRAPLVEAVHERTNGNPFFVTELARLLGGTRDLSTATVDTLLQSAVPTGVRDVIRGRLALLPAGAADLLSVAAVVGRHFDLDVLARVTKQSDERALELVEAALTGRMLMESHDVVGRYQFSHALVRETIYSQASAARRARLHQRVGDALEQLHGADDDRADELAHHYLQAAPAGAADQAFRYAVRAAELAVAKLAYEQAEEHLRRAVEVLELTPPGLERVQRELSVQLQLVRLLSWTMSFAAPEVGQACARARELCREVGESDQVGPLWSLWAFYTVLPDYRVALEVAARLLEIGEGGDRSFLMAGHWAFGVTSVQMGSLSQARDHLRRALVLADTMDDAPLIERYAQQPGVTCRAFSAMVLWLFGAHREAAALLRETLDLARRLEDPYTLTFALFVDAWLAIYRQDVPHARRRANEIFALSNRAGLSDVHRAFDDRARLGASRRR